MKNAKILSLSLVSLLLLSACGGQSAEPVGNVDTDTPQIEQPEQPDTAPNGTETPDEPDEAAPGVDRSWPSNDYEMQLPEPPFENWEVTRYERYEEGNNWRADAYQTEYDTVKAYADALREAGFVEDEEESDSSDGGFYTFKAGNAAGYRVRLNFESDKVNSPGDASVALWRAEAPISDPAAAN